MALRNQLVALLADGHFHSGESLGRQLAVSRAAVWKQVRKLSEYGLDVHAVRGKGYRLSQTLELLDSDRIRQSFSASTAARLQTLHIAHELDSTSDYLKRSAVPVTPGQVHTCLAEWQHAGRGRRGRQWVSPYGANLYGSLAWGFEHTSSALSGLSLAAGIAVVRSLRRLGVEGAGLKWPNDVLLAGRKLAGLLVDLSGEGAGPCTVIIGIGINLQMPASAAAQIDQAWTDLSSCGVAISRNRLAAELINELVRVLERFSTQGLSAFQDEWRGCDVMDGQPVNLQTGQQLIQGTACGIDEQGALRVESQGHIRSYHAGEISVRLQS